MCAGESEIISQMLGKFPLNKCQIESIFRARILYLSSDTMYNRCNKQEAFKNGIVQEERKCVTYI